MKYFSIDRVFRNETLDATHLAEFHQIEGVVADYGLTLGDLIGLITLLKDDFFTNIMVGFILRYSVRVFQKIGYRATSFQTCLQSLH